MMRSDWRFHCSRLYIGGVVLSTGGFSANAEMVQEYNTSGKWDDLSNLTGRHVTAFCESDIDGSVREISNIYASLTKLTQHNLTQIVLS